jgi:hypothetical protein
MPRRGYRPGAGRPPGASTAKSRGIAERAFQEGITPLEVMLDNMRFYHSEAIRLVATLIAGGMPRHLAEGDEAKPDAPKDDQPHANIIEAIGQVLGLRKLAGAEAARAAPYMHPRMGYASDGEGHQDDYCVPLAERLKEYQRRDDLKSAGDKVVELKSQDGQRPGPSSLEPIPPTIS